MVAAIDGIAVRQEPDRRRRHEVESGVTDRPGRALLPGGENSVYSRSACGQHRIEVGLASKDGGRGVRQLPGEPISADKAVGYGNVKPVDFRDLGPCCKFVPAMVRNNHRERDLEHAFRQGDCPGEVRRDRHK